jgi:hypothetical protein
MAKNIQIISQIRKYVPLFIVKILQNFLVNILLLFMHFHFRNQTIKVKDTILCVMIIFNFLLESRFIYRFFYFHLKANL